MKNTLYSGDNLNILGNRNWRLDLRTFSTSGSLERKICGIYCLGRTDDQKTAIKIPTQTTNKTLFHPAVRVFWESSTKTYKTCCIRISILLGKAINTRIKIPAKTSATN